MSQQLEYERLKEWENQSTIDRQFSDEDEDDEGRTGHEDWEIDPDMGDH